MRVRGTVSEYQGLTELERRGSGGGLLAKRRLPVVALSLPVPSPDAWETLEGMLVGFTQELTVAEVYNLGRYGEVTLAGGGRPVQFTQLNPPSVAGYAAYQADLALRTVILDDGNAQQNRDPILYPDPGLTAANTLRVGDTVSEPVGGGRPALRQLPPAAGMAGGTSSIPTPGRPRLRARASG